MQRFRPVLIVLVLVVASACSDAGQQKPGDSASPESSVENPSGRMLPIPGTDPEPSGSSPEVATRLTWSIPEGWVEEAPSSPMRLAQYRVGGSGGDGQCLVFYFGPGQGGDVMGNATRWAGQFTQPDGSPATDAMRVSDLDSTAFPTTIVEVQGTYNGGMSVTDAPAEPMPGYRLLGAVVRGPDAPWFFKFTGPEATVDEHRQAFLDLVASIRNDG